MRIPRIYQPVSLNNDTAYVLSKVASDHLIKVLRLSLNDQIMLFDGNGRQAVAMISSIAGKQVSVRTTTEPELTPAPIIKLHLGLAISKGDRMDYAIQKAVEAGVNEITPLMSERTIVKLDASRSAKRNDHWQAVITNACEQCEQNYLPALNTVTTLMQWSQDATSDLRLFFDATAKNTLHTIPPQTNIRITIGPEGGLSLDEIKLLASSGFTGVRLGPRVLRTETAAVSACVAIQTLWGDYKN